jgi:hypothetical protein
MAARRVLTQGQQRWRAARIDAGSIARAPRAPIFARSPRAGRCDARGMVDDHKTYAPLVLFEYDDRPGNYCLMMSDLHMADVMEAFEPHGQYGNGYGWGGVARQAIRSRAPGLEPVVSYDNESGTFVAHSADLTALERLGAILRDAFHDRALLDELIRDAEPDWFD